MEETKVKTSMKKCDNCGGNLMFNPTLQKLHCKNCGSVKRIDFVKEYDKHPISEMPKDYSSHEMWVTSTKVTSCNNCGSQIIFDSYTYSDVCPYCGSNHVSDIDELPSLLPDAIIPFKFDVDKASEEFAARVKKKFFVISAFKKKLPEKHIKGIYIPSFSFDADSNSQYSGELLKVIRRDNVETIKRFKIKGVNEYHHRDISIESSSLINQGNLSGLLPYKMAESKQFNEDYIRGYSVEHFNTKIDTCFKSAKRVMDQQIRHSILKKYDYDEVEELNITTNYSNEMYTYILLPIYRLEYNYRNKQYINYMNGQTGKIGGKLPYSKLKIAIVTILGLLLLALIIMLNIDHIIF